MLGLIGSLLGSILGGGDKEQNWGQNLLQGVQNYGMGQLQQRAGVNLPNMIAQNQLGGSQQMAASQAPMCPDPYGVHGPGIQMNDTGLFYICPSCAYKMPK